MEQSPDAESELLRQQRKVRPISPHLSIYQPQLTWYGSAAHRITGCAIGGGKSRKKKANRLGDIWNNNHGYNRFLSWCSCLSCCPCTWLPI